MRGEKGKESCKGQGKRKRGTYTIMYITPPSISKVRCATNISVSQGHDEIRSDQIRRRMGESFHFQHPYSVNNK